MSGGKIALICGRGMTSAAVANRLEREFGQIAVLVEDKEPRSRFLKRRIKRLGLLEVAGQVIFTLLVPRLLKRRSAGRIAEILREADIDTDERLLDSGFHVGSVNSSEAIEWLQRERPNVVVVNGTRIIANRVLGAIQAPFVNTHCGITPTYRGSHGGYWALAAGDGANCGVTVHLVDEGIDTGGILAQAAIEPGPSDNFITYPYLQIAAALPHLVKAVRDALEDRLHPFNRESLSALWYHPTLWGYVTTGLRRKVW
jgi:folate-dependent phosphoribosylglycinamide formyltransferase PurN